MDKRTVHINHRGDSLHYQMVIPTEEGPVVDTMTGQALYNHVRKVLEEDDLCVITAYCGNTLSGVLKQISAIRAWGDLLPNVSFKIVDRPTV